MQDIDFLPIQCRREHVRRRSQPWRVVVVVVFALLLATAFCAQRARVHRTANELAAITPEYELALSQQNQLTQIQARLSSARTRAELLTYLRHPWPRTQLLAALLPPLPDEVTLQQLQIIAREQSGPVSRKYAVADRRSRSERRTMAEEEEKLPPAARDLKRLQRECDRTETVVLLRGTTTDSAALLDYLGQLGSQDLFAKAELDSIETAEHGETTAQDFSATLVVRPGYGQPDGPTGPKPAVAREISRKPAVLRSSNLHGSWL